MVPLTTVVAVAVSLSVLFIVCSVVGTIVWIRIRQERLSMAVANARNGRYARGLQNFPAETVTELSPEEGAALGQYGQLPYGTPTEWALMHSRERLVKPDPETSSILSEKPRSLRESLSRSRSKRWSKGGLRRPPRRSSLAPVGESYEKRSLEKPSFETRPSVSKDEVEVSAVEGVMELPAETSPRQSPDREEPRADSNLSYSGIWSVYMNRDYANSLFPVREDEHEGFDPYRLRVRGTSLTNQTAGTMPDQPVPPPPPCAYPPNRFCMSRNDPSIRLSSLSLDTADSSILEDGRTPMLIDSNFNSPALPPCPTFVPYSANDVGRLNRSFSTKGSLQGSFAFPSGSVELEGYRLERDRTSPRRSLTARSPSHSMERISPPPRRSESLSSSATKREPRFASLGNTPVLYPSANNIPAHWNGINYNTALLPHFSQIRRPSVHRHRPRESTDSLFSSTDNLLSVPDSSPSRRSSNVIVHETPLSADGLPRLPPPSAMKGGNATRKGHRRQNCVRISIHPPITFGGPVFSPMAEEPEEHEGADSRRSEVSELSATNLSSLPSVSTISIDGQNHHDRSRPPSYRRVSNRTSPNKRKHARTGSKDTGNAKALPGIDTSLPARAASLSRTPSPDKSPPVWTSTTQAPSPSTRENPPTPGEPRLSAVKGPRSQPGKQAKNTQRSPMPLAENPAAPPPSTSPNPRPNNPNRDPKSNSTVTRGSSNATENTSSTPDRDGAEGLEVVNGPQPTRPLSPSCGVNKTPSTRSGNIVTIWEDTKLDTKLERTLTKKSSASASSEAIELQGDVSFNQIERHKSTGRIKEPEGKDNNKPSRTASQRSTKQELTTPVKKTVGLGIGAATPGSLYDGDGFLKVKD